ncbi:MAG: hypothetical protein ACLP01_29090, partial [Solirubrobacteraceae bacterium]
TLAISEQVDAFDRDADVRADDGVVAIRPLLAGAGPLSKRETLRAKRPASPDGLTPASQQRGGVNVEQLNPAIAFAFLAGP